MLLASCVQLRARQNPLIVNVQADGDLCDVSVKGERVTSARLLQIGRSAGTLKGIVVYARGTPFKCVGGAVFTLQLAGLSNVDAAMWNGN